MSEYTEGPEQTCEYCESSVTGRKPGERVCFNMSPLRFLFFGPRFVKWCDTCPKFVLAKKYGGRQR